MTARTLRRIAGFYVFLVVFAVAPAAQQKHVPAETTRLIEILKLGPTSTVADIGAGEGEVTFELAKQLGSRARIYSTDVNGKTLAALKTRVNSQGLANVIVTAGEFEDTGLPAGCCDAVFVRHVYHHFGNPQAMNASLLRTLKPGGRFAVLDFPPRKPTAGPVPPAQRASGDTHGVTMETVVQELEAAGFRIVEVAKDWPGGLFLVLAERPAPPAEAGRPRGAAGLIRSANAQSRFGGPSGPAVAVSSAVARCRDRGAEARDRGPEGPAAGHGA